MSNNQNKSKYEITVDMIRSIIWPVLFASILISYSKPITETINQLPNLVAASSELSIAGVRVQVDRSIRAKTSPTVLHVMAQISPDGIKRLMSLSSGTPIFSDDESKRYKDEWDELIKLSLVEVRPWHGSEPKYKNALGVTTLGRDVQQFVFVLVSEITGRLKDDSK